MISTYCQVLPVLLLCIVISGCTHNFVAIFLNDRPSNSTLLPHLYRTSTHAIHILLSPLFSFSDRPHQGPPPHPHPVKSQL